ncbi:MAG: hypothetical protein ABSC55_17050 [Syntrophorhabdales bacterium]
MSLDPKEEAVLQLIQEDEAYENYFFKKVSAIKWFRPLKKLGFFSPQKAPGPRPADREGYFTVPQWNVLPYLESVSLHLTEPDNQAYIEELLNIIKDVTRYEDTEGRHIDNYRTWWYFVKILVNIPKDRIPLEIIDLIPIWLDSRFDTSLPGADIINKLLPEFLSSQPTEEDIRKAERIIGSITALKSRGGTDGKLSFLDEEKFECVIDNYWLEEGFKKYSDDIGRKCTETIVIDLCGKINKMLSKNQSKATLSIEGHSFLLTLQERVGVGYHVISYDLGENDPNKTYGKAFDEIMERREVAETLLGEYLVDSQEAESFVEKAYESLRKDKPFASYPDDDLKHDLYTLYTSLYSVGTYQSFYEEPRYGRDSAFAVLTFGLKRILLAMAEVNSKASSKILNGLFEEQHEYFSKLALYIIGNTGNAYIDQFWEVVGSEKWRKIFDSMGCEDELRHVLENIARDLASEQRNRLENLIESGPIYLRNENKEQWINLWKQERYQALSSDAYFRDKYDNLKQKTGMDALLSPAISDAGVSWEGPGPSPLTQEEILRMPNSDLANYLLGFQEKDPWQGPTARGLAEVLKQTAQQTPEKFVDDLSPFLSTGYLYVDYLVWGVRDAWANKKDIEWGELFDFLKRYLNRDDFWLDRLPMAGDRGWKPNHESVVGVIGELIQEGTKNDAWAFGETHFRDAKEVIWLIVDRLPYPPKDEGEYGDWVTHALNSSWGKIILGLIFLALEVARHEKNGTKKEVKWSKEFREEYDSLIEKEVLEAYTWLGMYLPQLRYLDKQWSEKTILSMGGRKGQAVWEAFMNGYLYGGRVYEDIYVLMRGHYEYAITFPFKNSRDKERLVQHISLGYLQGYETLEGESSLFKVILDKWSHDQIREIVRYFSMQRVLSTQQNEEAEKRRNRIAEFWELLYDKYSQQDATKLTKDDKRLLSDLSKLTIFLSGISSTNLKWLLLSVPYLHENYNAPFFIESLDQLKEKGDKAATADGIGQVYLCMLDHITPDFDEEHIKSIVSFLYEAGAKEKADTICNTYAKRGYEFLRALFEKHKRLA